MYVTLRSSGASFFLFCFVFIAFRLSCCFVEAQSPHQAMVFQSQLSQQTPFVPSEVSLDRNKLSIFAVQPGTIGWPVVLAGVYDDDTINKAYLVFEWTFPDGDDQTCTQAGRTMVLPCRGMVVEKTFLQASPSDGYNISLSVSYPGEDIIRASVLVKVTETFTGPVVTRRDYKTLPPGAFDRMIEGFMELKNMGIWDHLTYIHQVRIEVYALHPKYNNFYTYKVAAFTGVRPGTQRNAAHRGPALLPWHRAFVRHMERTMQAILNDTSFGMPYWDWSQDVRNPTSTDLWTDKLLGPTGDPTMNFAVPSGYFCGVSSSKCQSNWTVPWDLGGPVLERELGRLVRSLPSPIQVANVLAVPTYDMNPYDSAAPPPSSFRMAVEGAGGTFYGLFHNGVHSWIGGAMASMASPNDPAFWLHHSYVDKLFYQWQRRHNCQTDCYRPTDRDATVTQLTPGAQLVNGVYKIRGHHWSDAMYPWSLRPRDIYPVPNNQLNGYQYDNA